MVTGPPGAGKSLAVASWAATRPAPAGIAWVSIDSFDNSPATFWRYVLEALQRAEVGLPADLAAAVTGPRERFVRRLAALLARQDPAVTLVLDDLHLLTEPEVLDGLAYVLRHADPGLRLVAASRMDPLLPLYRYRLTGELTEIRAADLAFTAAEAQKLLAKHGITLSAESVASLTRRNEGWAAGLRLAALSMLGHPDPELFVREFDANDSVITGYLMDEVLGSQPPEVRELLLKTSILERVSDELACELAGSERVAGVIPELARQNSFILALGQGWYRFHPLFADALRLKLRRQAPHEVPRLRRRAARWLQRHGAALEAARQAAQAGDWQLAARVAVGEFAVGAIIDPLASEPFAALFRQMPADLVTAEPAVCIIAAALSLREQRDEAVIAWLRRAEGALARGPADAELPSGLAVAEIRFSLARRAGDPGAAQAATAQAEALLAKMPREMLAAHPEVRVRVLSHRGLVEMWAGSLGEAAALLDQAAANTRKSGDRADYIGQRALAEAARGRLGQAAELACTATDPAVVGRGFTSRTAAGELALAWACVERNELSESAARLARAGEVLRGRPDKLVNAVADLVTVRQRLARNDARTAAETARQARRGWSPPVWLDRKLSLAESLALTVAGDYKSAVTAASRAAPSEALEAAVAQARILLAAGNPRAASRVLARAPSAAGGETPGYLMLEARLVEAELAYRSEDPVSGRRSLQRALRLADREQLRLPITLQKAWIQPVLRRDPELADGFRRLFSPAVPGLARGIPESVSQPQPVVVEPLSAREREVLQGAAGMLSTAEIASQMYVSVNTIKSHFKSIFRKLGASHRGEAVRRARQLGML